MRKTLLVLTLAVIIAFTAIQFVPGAPRDNPPATAPVAFPPEVENVVRDACMDCHSNETRWPWYSRIAPTSWYVTRDVQRARAVMNFSDWGNLPAKRRYQLLQGIWNNVVERDMPHKQYILMHPKVELNANDRKAVRDWLNERIYLLELEEPSLVE
jgi:hypothetical protein